MTFDIPLFKLNYDQDERQAILDVLESRWISMGPKCQEFEALSCDMLGTKYALSVSNCTSALHMALVALGVGQNDEVIAPSLTFVATVNAIKYVGATPVFCDISGYDQLTIDPEQIRQLITSKTKVIIVMHYAGFPCDMDEIVNIVTENNLKIIEDASHAPLSDYKGKKLGTIGDFGCFSFYSNKNISTGEGGLLITQQQRLYEKVKLLRSHGMTTLSYERFAGHQTSYDVVELGFNYRMDDMRAALAIVQMKKLPQDLKIRADLREYYIDKLSRVEGIIIPFKEEKGFVSNYIFPIVLKNSTADKRNAVRAVMKDHRIQTSVHYPAVHKFSIYNDTDQRLDITEYVSNNEITLPLYSGMTKQDIDRIVSALQLC